ncbi:MAG TPA: hypothetical protein VKR58_03535, partial [Aquella sp.]|nr:hypothetical protein [Aquella sp.]
MKLKLLFNSLNILILLLVICLFCTMLSGFALNLPLMDDYDSGLIFLNKFVSATSLHDKILLLLSQSDGTEHRITTTRVIELLYYKMFGEINFRNLIFIADFILLMCIFPIYFLL